MGGYQVEFADLHQLLSFRRDLLHVDGDGEHGVGATANRHTANIDYIQTVRRKNQLRPIDQNQTLVYLDWAFMSVEAVVLLADPRSRI